MPNPVLPPPAARTTYFDALATALVVGLILAVVIGLAGITGPGLFTAAEAALAGGVALFVLAAILFIHIATVRRTLEGVRMMITDHAANVEAGVPVAPVAEPVVAPADTVARAAEPMAVAVPVAVPEVVAEPAVPVGVPTAPTMTAAEEKQHVITIEGIGEVMATRLNRIGVITIPQLLRADPAAIAKQIDAMPLVVREWQWMGQLMSVKGIGPQTAELLVRCGVHSIEDLAIAKPDDIVAEAQRLKETRKVRITGTEVGPAGAKRWIEAAKAQVADSGVVNISEAGTTPGIDVDQVR